MIDLAQTYEKAGLFLAPGELPDYLPAVLEFVSTQPPREARAFLSEMAHIFNAIFGALQQRESAYASVLGALLELAGEKAQPVELAAEEPLDESWVEPPVFDGCSTKGQAKPGQPQPIHIVRKARTPAQERRHEHVLSTHFLFGVYPYICLTVFLLGSLIRFDQNQYTLEKRFVADAARRHAALGQQSLPRRHPVPVLRPMVGLLTPHWLYGRSSARRPSRCWRSSRAASRG